MRVCRVDKGDDSARKTAKLQQEHLHDEDSQHDENARDNVPEAHGMQFEGEWAASASDSVKSSSGGTAESNALLDVPIVMSEHTPDGSRESKDTEDTAEVELNSCWTGAQMHAYIDEASYHTDETAMSSRTPMD